MIKTLFDGQATLGNDNPIWTGYPVTRPVGEAAGAEHHARQGAAGGRGQVEPVVHDHDLQDAGDPGPRADHPVGRRTQAGINITLEFLSASDYYGSAPGADYQHDHAVAEPPVRDHRLRVTARSRTSS